MASPANPRGHGPNGGRWGIGDRRLKHVSQNCAAVLADMHKNKEIKRVAFNLLPQYTTVEIIDGAGCRYTPLCPAGHLPLKGEIVPWRGFAPLDDRE
ncbi:hypothetical protein AGR7C_Cc100049 [Agrobacterium deltaense Zutra 3/1]|uniref:Uncharacterized protein n=1 Tax=Agrobacterium deltaense Zutra 3/1 TaxID=1183427 RepID=A0A1S7NVJ1_9HYPH|nr:hypothetical protein AGR7C_Cc100049 [Agrobacterium deltaense Zutra 3/1]